MNDKVTPQKATVSTDVEIEYTIKVVNGQLEVVVHNFNVNVESLKNKVEEDLNKAPYTMIDSLAHNMAVGLANFFTGTMK